MNLETLIEFMDFAPLIKKARKSSGLTQTEVAEMSNVSRSAVVDLERGRGTMTTLTSVSATIDFRIAGLSRGKSFGDQVQKRRARLKWTQKKLAERTGLTLPTIRAVEKDRANLTSFSKVIEIIGDKPKPRREERSYWRGGQRDVRHTPPRVLNAITDCFGQIDCDPCHDPESYVKPRLMGITKDTDGLKTRWVGDVCFVNPPFSELSLWLKRIDLALARSEVKTVIALVPLRSEIRAFQDCVLNKADLLLPRGRIRFHSGGEELGPAPFPIVFPIWRANPIEVKKFAETINAVWMVQKNTTNID